MEALDLLVGVGEERAVETRKERSRRDGCMVTRQRWLLRWWKAGAGRWLKSRREQEMRSQ